MERHPSVVSFLEQFQEALRRFSGVNTVLYLPVYYRPANFGYKFELLLKYKEFTVLAQTGWWVREVGGMGPDLKAPKNVEGYQPRKLI